MSNPFELPTLNGAERLYAALFPDMELRDIPTDAEETLEKVFREFDDYRVMVVKKYFWDGLTYSQIAEIRNSSAGVVKKILQHTLTVLKNKVHAAYLKRGEKYYRAERYKRLCDELAFEQHELAKLEKMIDDIKCRKAELKAQIKTELEVNEYEEIEETYDSDNIPITELGLSSRTYNALKHGHIRTVGDLRRINRNQYWGVRQLGPKGIEETRTAVAKKTGIPLDEYKPQ